MGGLPSLTHLDLHGCKNLVWDDQEALKATLPTTSLAFLDLGETKVELEVTSSLTQWVSSLHVVSHPDTPTDTALKQNARTF